MIKKWQVEMWLKVRADKFFLWLARRVPRTLKYWVVAVVAGRTKGNPAEMTALQMLEILGKPWPSK